MRVVGVPVIYGDPIQTRAQVPLHLVHQVTRGRAQIAQLIGVLRGHDEAEVMAVWLGSCGEGSVIGRAITIEDFARPSVPPRSAPSQIVEVRADTRGPEAGAVVTYDPSLDDHLAARA